MSKKKNLPTIRSSAAEYLTAVPGWRVFIGCVLKITPARGTGTAVYEVLQCHIAGDCILIPQFLGEIFY
jgi:hypothetical protein